MLNTFKDKLKITVNRDSGLCHLSISTTEYKVEVHKVSIGDMEQLISSFANQRNTKDFLNGSNDRPPVGPPEVEGTNEIEENN